MTTSFKPIELIVRTGLNLQLSLLENKITVTKTYAFNDGIDYLSVFFKYITVEAWNIQPQQVNGRCVLR